MWFMVCRWPQSQQGDWAWPHLCKLARHGPWHVRKRFIRDHVWWGRRKPGCRIVGSLTIVWLTTEADDQSSLHCVVPVNSCWHADNTHVHPFNGPLSGTTQVSRYQKVKSIWILVKQETVSGSGISWAVCKSAPRSRQITTPAPHHSVFYRPDALPAAQPTVSEHWNQDMLTSCKKYLHLCLLWHSLKMECEKLAQEKTEMQRHYVMVCLSICRCVLLFVLCVLCSYSLSVSNQQKQQRNTHTHTHV